MNGDYRKDLRVRPVGGRGGRPTFPDTPKNWHLSNKTLYFVDKYWPFTG
jgi:hypothetical protein